MLDHHPSLHTSHRRAQASSECERAWTVVITRAQGRLGNSLMGYTILDVLNADCWRLVLDYVSVRDVVRSERVSRGWQRVVRDYLAGVHRLVHLYNDDNFFSRRPIYANCHVIELEKHDFFKDVVAKLGPFIVAVTAQLNQEKLEAIARYCPNLKSLTAKIDDTINISFSCIRKCSNLRRILLHSKQIEDKVLLDAVTNENLEEVAVIGAHLTTGYFFQSLKSNLKILILEDGFCETRFLLSAVDRLTELKRLELNSQRHELIHEIHLLLSNTPNLEYLSLTNYFHIESVNAAAQEAALCRLSSLKELYLVRNTCVTREWMVAVAHGCPALRVLDIGFCLSLNGHEVVAVCRARPELMKLSICHIPVTDENVETAVRCCTDLEYLDISWCYRLTKGITGLISWPRPQPLRLRVFGNRAEKKGTYEGIKILRERPLHQKARY